MSTVVVTASASRPEAAHQTANGSLQAQSGENHTSGEHRLIQVPRNAFDIAAEKRGHSGTGGEPDDDGPSSDDDDDSDRSELPPARRKRRRNGRKKDLTFRHNPKLLRYPERDDFLIEFGGLRATDYVWGPSPTEEAFADHRHGQNSCRSLYRAPRPSVPDPMDDDPCYDTDADEDTENPEEDHPPKDQTKEKGRKPRKAVPKPRKRAPVTPTTKEATPEIESISGRVMAIPETRRQILRACLVANAPYSVYSGWRNTYKRGKPTVVNLSILRTNSQLYSEGTQILYGENTFLYRLRDAPQTAIADVEALPFDDDADVTSDDATEEGSEWGGGHNDDDHENDADDEDGEYVEESYNTHRNGRRRRQPTPEPGNDINVAKFRPLFRHLIIEAEHNRFGEQTQVSMAKAISVFMAPQVLRRNDKTAPKIKDIVIRVAPRDTGRGFTFLRFFSPGSPVMRALRLVEFQYLHVDMGSKCLLPSVVQPADGSDDDFIKCVISLDMRHRSLAIREATPSPDIWANDHLMLAARERHAKAMDQGFDNLQRSFLKHCHKCIRKPRIGLGFLDENDMDEYDVLQYIENGFMSDENEIDEMPVAPLEEIPAQPFHVPIDEPDNLHALDNIPHPMIGSDEEVSMEPVSLLQQFLDQPMQDAYSHGDNDVQTNLDNPVEAQPVADGVVGETFEPMEGVQEI